MCVQNEERGSTFKDEREVSKKVFSLCVKKGINYIVKSRIADKKGCN